jgi:hypothetical protein
MAGYSGKPVVQKLGIRPGFRIFTAGLSIAYRDIVGELPDDVTIAKGAKAPLDMVHLFVIEATGLAAKLRSYRAAIDPDGMIWVSWPKKASGVATDVTETVVRDTALPLGRRHQGLRDRRCLVGAEVRDPERPARQTVEIGLLFVGQVGEFGMPVIECDLPPGSVLGRDAVKNAYFHDSYRAPLTREGLGIVELFFALFGHTPVWMKLLLIARNAVARIFGLEAPTVGEIIKPTIRSEYRVGDKIGPWPIFFIADNEIVAGRNNRHLDFRVSVLKAKDGEKASVIISTICSVHNVFGKIYLFFIVPFHRTGVRALMSNAIAAKRL